MATMLPADTFVNRYRMVLRRLAKELAPSLSALVPRAAAELTSSESILRARQLVATGVEEHDIPGGRGY